MAEAIATYTTKVSGLWNTRHEIRKDGELLGELCLQRNGLGVVVGGEYRPTKGEVLLFRRDPGLLRSQFSLWTDGREWLGSSLRWSFLKRVVSLNTGGKPFRLAPLAGLHKGWALYAPKTGETCRITSGLLGRGAKIEVYRKTDFALVLFAYFLGSQIYFESFLPGPKAEQMSIDSAI